MRAESPCAGTEFFTLVRQSRKLDPAQDGITGQGNIMDQLSKYSPLIARIFIGLFFLLSGVGKLANVGMVMESMESVGLPGILLWPTLLFEAALGLSLLLGYRIRLAALAGAGFCILTALVFHTNFANPVEMVMFLKNFSIAGAFLMFFAHGAGAVALDK